VHRRNAYDDDTGGHIAYNTRHKKKNVDRCDGRENKHWNLLGTKIVMQIIVNVSCRFVCLILHARSAADSRDERRRLKYFIAIEKVINEPRQ